MTDKVFPYKARLDLGSCKAVVTVEGPTDYVKVRFSNGDTGSYHPSRLTPLPTPDSIAEDAAEGFAIAFEDATGHVMSRDDVEALAAAILEATTEIARLT
jgi:hypothetical protein